MATASAEDRKQTASSLRAGDMLDGRYRVDYLVGRGGMAEVWAGTNERTGKRVALKLLLPSVAAAPGADALFHGEGLAASRVNHPNVVTVFDVIQHGDAACIVMELLSGESLDVYLSRARRLSLQEAYGLLVPAMRGVAAAHARGVIHRDVKPQNIFICVGPDGRPVTTKVLDFGISLIREMDTANGPGAGLPMGTPAYMAPEQIAGSDTIDERADVYGFGVLLFEILTGELPFPGPAGSELYRRILFDPAPPLASLRPDLPRGILRLVDVALAKNARDRHANLDTMITLFEAEMAFATPLPGVLGPSTASPSPVLIDPASRATITPWNEAPDERHATRFLVNFPLEPAPAPAERARVTPAAPATVSVARPRPWPVRMLAPTWRGLVAVGLAGLVAGVAYVVWLKGGQGAVTVRPPTVDVRPAPVPAQPVAPVSPPPAPASEAAVLEAAVASPPAVAAVTEDVDPPAKSRRPVIARKAGVGKLDRRRAAAAAVPAVDRADPVMPSARSALVPPPFSTALGPKPLAKTKPARPRAGALTTDDF